MVGWTDGRMDENQEHLSTKPSSLHLHLELVVRLNLIMNFAGQSMGRTKALWTSRLYHSIMMKNYRLFIRYILPFLRQNMFLKINDWQVLGVSVQLKKIRNEAIRNMLMLGKSLSSWQAFINSLVCCLPLQQTKSSIKTLVFDISLEVACHYASV